MRLIDKDVIITEIERQIYAIDNSPKLTDTQISVLEGNKVVLTKLLSFINSLDVKEVDEQKERISECPYRQVGCTMYEGHILECRGACSWVVDYPKLKELKAMKGE